MPSPRLISVLLATAGFIGGIAFVTACPLAEPESDDWLDSDGATQDERPGVLRVTEAAASPASGGPTRVISASDDSTRWMGGSFGGGAIMLAQGPFFVTDARAANSGGEYELYISNAACNQVFEEVVNVNSGRSVTGMRHFVRPGEFLCKQNGSGSWSGFRPY